MDGEALCVTEHGNLEVYGVFKLNTLKEFIIIPYSSIEHIFYISINSGIPFSYFHLVGTSIYDSKFKEIGKCLTTINKINLWKTRLVQEALMLT